MWPESSKHHRLSWLNSHVPKFLPRASGSRKSRHLCFQVKMQSQVVLSCGLQLHLQTSVTESEVLKKGGQSDQRHTVNQQKSESKSLSHDPQSITLSSSLFFLFDRDSCVCLPVTCKSEGLTNHCSLKPSIKVTASQFNAEKILVLNYCQQLPWFLSRTQHKILQWLLVSSPQPSRTFSGARQWQYNQRLSLQV